MTQQPVAVADIIRTSDFDILRTPYIWARGIISSEFTPTVPDRATSGNVHIVPFVGRNCVIMKSKEAGWDIPGGTLDQGEPFESAIHRELTEELGARTTAYQLFAGWHSVSSAASPYRGYLPHPEFDVALGWADIELVTSPTSDDGVLQETVLEIAVLPANAACAKLKSAGLPHLAAVYQIAAALRGFYTD